MLTCNPANAVPEKRGSKISTSVAMAAELFHEAGYATGGFVSSVFVSSRFGFELRSAPPGFGR